METPHRNKENLNSHPSWSVRVIARIRGYTERELARKSSAPWILIKKPNVDASETVTLSFGAHSASSKKESCQVDYCYDHDEDSDKVYSREIKPLISGVFDGRNATVVAYGAVGSGKTHTIQGSEEKPGLAVLAMDDLISTAERLGMSVTTSLYEIFQEHVYDLLDPERQAITILEYGRGRIQLKGLSQVPVKSVSEFWKTYLSAGSSRKAIQKPESELSRRSHRGLIVHVVNPTNHSESSPVAKMNFVDMAGYEDSRRKRSEDTSISENSLTNKSLYALQKVVLALSGNESHVPFRESKLTRMLQDSLGGINRFVFVACLNPTSCQDSIYMANLGSRTWQGVRRAVIEKNKSMIKPATLSSVKGRILQSASASMRKQTSSRMIVAQKKAIGATPIRGKKLFSEASNPKKCIKGTSTSSVAATLEDEARNEATSSDTAPSVEITSPKKEVSVLEQEKSCVDAAKEMAPAPSEEVSQDASRNSLENHGDLSSDTHCAKEVLPIKEGDIMDKEYSIIPVDVGGSPPLSARLREICNSLKLIGSTPTFIELQQKSDLLCDGQVPTEPKDFEPRTPLFASTRQNEIPCLTTPREVSKTCYPGSKNSIAQEYLRFVNSASKEELKGLKGIGEKRATYILKLREDSPEPFKTLNDLKGIGLSAKQIKGMMAMK